MWKVKLDRERDLQLHFRYYNEIIDRKTILIFLELDDEKVILR